MKSENVAGTLIMPSCTITLMRKKILWGMAHVKHDKKKYFCSAILHIGDFNFVIIQLRCTTSLSLESKFPAQEKRYEGNLKLIMILTVAMQ